MLVLLRHPSRRFCIRHFHNSTRLCNLVGPIDPISHMRPVIYDDVPTNDHLPSGHPYSLTEFSLESFNTAGQNGLQLKLQQQQVDTLNQNFWLDVSFHSLFVVNISLEPPRIEQHPFRGSESNCAIKPPSLRQYSRQRNCTLRVLQTVGLSRKTSHRRIHGRMEKAEHWPRLPRCPR